MFRYHLPGIINEFLSFWLNTIFFPQLMVVVVSPMVLFIMFGPNLLNLRLVINNGRLYTNCVRAFSVDFRPNYEVVEERTRHWKPSCDGRELIFNRLKWVYYMALSHAGTNWIIDSVIHSNFIFVYETAGLFLLYLTFFFTHKLIVVLIDTISELDMSTLETEVMFMAEKIVETTTIDNAGVVVVTKGFQQVDAIEDVAEEMRTLTLNGHVGTTSLQLSWGRKYLAKSFPNVGPADRRRIIERSIIMASRPNLDQLLNMEYKAHVESMIRSTPY